LPRLHKRRPQNPARASCFWERKAARASALAHPTEDVGRIAAAAGVKVLVLSHFVPGDDPLVTDDNWTEDVKKNFSGRIVVAKDLMQLPLPV
jgi:ribonuclease BN (tRNA processing enzyme)